jgi:hypothetical protein
MPTQRIVERNIEQQNQTEQNQLESLVGKCWSNDPESSEELKVNWLYSLPTGFEDFEEDLKFNFEECPSLCNIEMDDH